MFARSSSGCGNAPSANVIAAVIVTTAVLSTLGTTTTGGSSGGSVKNINTMTRT